MSFRTFAESAVRLRGTPFSLAIRPYLHDVYACTKARLVLRTSRQVEKSTLLCNRVVYDAVRIPGRQILIVCPRRDQANLFSRTRLHPVIQQSPSLRRLLWPHERPMPVRDMALKNGSSIFIRSAFHTADACRGISADQLVIDEFQDMADQSLSVLSETLSHSPRPYIILAGTPKWIENPIETAFRASTACEWHVPCPGCGQATLLNEKTLGPGYLACPACEHPLDPRLGSWIARNPSSTWGDGYTINHLMVPWLSVNDILQRQQNYDRAQFVNEVLGLPTSLGDHVVTREEIEACCEDRPFVQSIDEVPPAIRRNLVIGVDWGGGSHSGTVAVIGHAANGRHFRVLRFDRWLPHEDSNRVLDEVFALCRRFRILWISADDNGGGSYCNRVLLKNLWEVGQRPNMFGILYTAETKSPIPHGALTQWSVGRTATIGGLVSRIKLKLTLFPRVLESGSFLDEFTCELLEVDDKTRIGQYTKPDDARDDALHATNYAQLLALRVSHSESEFA